MKSTRVDRPFKPKYIQYSVSSTFAAGCSSQARSVFPVASPPNLFLPGTTGMGYIIIR